MIFKIATIPLLIILNILLYDNDLLTIILLLLMNIISISVLLFVLVTDNMNEMDGEV